ncbi:Aste57867_18343 [Aphanomyces stellatus]|uniref:Aste57867_18343 protein n=1 Tax=Aphanomyces stellatus TaxID=120398 RepID=A0A485LAF8_9STRA|nr:hypothetical protein As57867_018281 [Aphanomyces stellatus]VFT95079.1 Aste57867_18343 [Aphanomyces stellatus]
MANMSSSAAQDVSTLTLFLTCYNVQVAPKPAGFFQGAIASLRGQVETAECQIRVDRIKKKHTFWTEPANGPNPTFALGIQIPLIKDDAMPPASDVLTFTLIRTQDSFNVGSAVTTMDRLVMLARQGLVTEHLPFEIFGKVKKTGVDPVLRITLASVLPTEHPLLQTRNLLLQAYSFSGATPIEGRKMVVEEAMEPDYATSIPMMFLTHMHKELQVATQLWNIRCHNERKRQLVFEDSETALASGCDVFEVAILGARGLKVDNSTGFADSLLMNPYVRVEFGETTPHPDLDGPNGRKNTDVVLLGRTMTETNTNDPNYSRQRTATLSGRTQSMQGPAPPLGPPSMSRGSSTQEAKRQASPTMSAETGGGIMFASSFTFYRRSHASNSKGVFVFKVFHEIPNKKDPSAEDYPIGQCVVGWNITKPCDDEFNYCIDQWVSIYPAVDRRSIYSQTEDLGKLHIQVKIKCSTIRFALQNEAAFRQVEKTPLFRLADINKDHKLRKLAKGEKSSNSSITQEVPETSIADLKWHVTTLEHYLDELESMIDHVKAQRHAQATFRASVMKKEILWQPVATNLHLSYFTTYKETQKGDCPPVVDEVNVSVTCGAPTAHGLPDKHGLLDLEEEMMKVLPTFDRTKHVYVYRKILCVSQSLSALVTAFMAQFELCINDDSSRGNLILKQWAAIGFLFQWESLVSSQGKEFVMLNDCWIAIKTLGRFFFKIVKEIAPGHGSIYMLTREDQKGYVLHVPVPARVFDALPGPLQQGQHIAVVPIVFSQGINEMQTLANMTKSTDVELQHKINILCAKTLETYVTAFVEMESGLRMHHDSAAIRAMLETLKMLLAEETMQKAKKNYRLLLVASDIVRLLNGGRVTFCKSGKDRTAMAVTLEQTRMVHGTSSEKMDIYDTIKPIANVMREFGVRIRVAEKNVGRPRYTFNGLQRKMLPKMYRPPLRSIQGGMASGSDLS